MDSARRLNPREPAAQTVTGPLPLSALGHCQPHEHLIVRAGPMTRENPALLIDDEALSLEELLDYKSAGGGGVIDAQPGGAGRDAAALKRISAASGAAVVTVTGYHLPSFYPRSHEIHSASEDALADWFASELALGVIDGGERLPIRAGAVKSALGEEGADADAARKLRAAARSAAGAAVPMLIHTERGIGGVDAVRICEAEGVPPRRIMICHADRQTEDIAVHEAIARTGASLEYDTIARPRYHGDESEIRLILAMLDKGYLGQILMSLDTTARRLRRYGGAIGLDYLLTAFLPKLRASGVSREDIDVMTRVNPRRVFL